MELYFEGVTEAIKDGYRPKLVPVRFYRMRQLWFDIRYMIRYVVKGRLSALIAKLCLRGPLETELWRKGLALKLPRYPTKKSYLNAKKSWSRIPKTKWKPSTLDAYGRWSTTF